MLCQPLRLLKILGKDTEIFVESANLFRYEQDDGNTGLVVADGFIVNQNEPVVSVTATVSTAGTISALTIVDGGAGYADGAVEISIANPPRIDRPKYGIVGVGSTAILSASASGGIVTSVSIDYEGVDIKIPILKLLLNFRLQKLILSRIQM